MRIVYCISNFTNPGGTEKIVVEKANRLSLKYGYEVFIIVAFSRKPLAFSLDKKVQLINLDIPYYDDMRFSRFFRIIWSIIMRFKHRKALKKELNSLRPDVIIAVQRELVYLVSMISLPQKPIKIGELHTNRYNFVNLACSWDDALVERIKLLKDYIYLYKFDKVVVLSTEEKLAWPYKSKMVVIPNFVCDRLPSPSSLNAKVVISGGRLVKDKNFVSMISSWRHVANLFPNWQLHIYGEGPEQERLSGLIKEYGLSDTVFLKGFEVNFAEKLGEASVFCLTSSSESFSLVTLEAMSAGLPVVAYDCKGGLHDLVKTGENGYLVSQGDESEFAEKLGILLLDSSLRKIMGENSRGKARQYVSERIMGQWVDLFCHRS